MYFEIPPLQIIKIYFSICDNLDYNSSLKSIIWNVDITFVNIILMMISKNHNMYEDFTIANEKCSSIDNIWWFFIITCIIFLYVIRFCDKGSSFSEKSLWHNEHLFFVNSLYPESVCMLCLILKWWTKTHSRII